MTSKDTQTQDESQKSGVRTIPVDPESLDRVRALQDEFAAKIPGGRISQAAIANKAIQKVTLADILPQLEAA